MVTALNFHVVFRWQALHMFELYRPSRVWRLDLIAIHTHPSHQTYQYLICGLCRLITLRTM